MNKLAARSILAGVLAAILIPSYLIRVSVVEQWPNWGGTHPRLIALYADILVPTLMIFGGFVVVGFAIFFLIKLIEVAFK